MIRKREIKTLICTGMDNSGKSTLTKQLIERFNGVELRHSPGPEPHKVQEDWLRKQIVDNGELQDGKDIVYDRFAPFEEMVYGPILRSGSLFDMEDTSVRMLKLFRPIIVYTRPPRGHILNFGDRPQMDGVITHGELLLNSYDELMFRLMAEGWTVLVYDYTKKYAFEKLINKLVEITTK